MGNISNYALIGGPCGGKSETLPHIVRVLEEEGFNALPSKETATKLIERNLIPGETISLYDFQDLLFREQLETEKRLNELASSIKNDRIAIVYDRPLTDGQFYISDEEFGEIISSNGGFTMESLVGRYKYFIHFRSVVIGKPYLFNTNGRLEDIENAIRLENDVESFYHNIPNRIVLENNCSFKEKQENALTGVRGFARSEMRRVKIKDIDRDFLEHIDKRRTTDADGQIRHLITYNNITYTLGTYQDGSGVMTLEVKKESPLPDFLLSYEEVPQNEPKKLLKE